MLTKHKQNALLRRAFPASVPQCLTLSLMTRQYILVLDNPRLKSGRLMRAVRTISLQRLLHLTAWWAVAEPLNDTSKM